MYDQRGWLDSPLFLPPSMAPRLFAPSANSLPLGEGGREPIKALVKTVARCGTACLDIPLPVTQTVQAQLVGHLRCRHCVGEVLYIREAISEVTPGVNQNRGWGRTGCWCLFSHQNPRIKRCIQHIESKKTSCDYRLVQVESHKTSSRVGRPRHFGR